MFKKYIERIKKHFRDIIEIKTEPGEIAIGFAIGTFFANFPTFGLEFFAIFLILMLFKKISKISLLFAYVIWNPFITYPIGGLSYVLGNYILGDAPVTIVRFVVFQNFIQFTIRYMLGSLIVATFFAIISYFVILYLSKKYQRKEIFILQRPLEISNSLKMPVIKI